MKQLKVFGRFIFLFIILFSTDSIVFGQEEGESSSEQGHSSGNEASAEDKSLEQDNAGKKEKSEDDKSGGVSFGTSLIESKLIDSFEAKLNLWEGVPPVAGSGSIEDLTQHAFNNCSEIRLLQIEQNKTKIDLFDAKANFFPKIDFSTYMFFIANPVDPVTVDSSDAVSGGTMLPLSDITGGLSDYTLYNGMESTYYHFGIDFEQPVFTWGKITNAVFLFKKIEDINDIRLVKLKNEIRTEITILFYTLYYLKNIDEQIGKQQEVTNQLISLLSQSYEAGFIEKSDYLEVQINARELDLAFYKLEDAKNKALQRLRQLTGLERLDIPYFNFENLEEPDYKVDETNISSYVNLAKLNSTELDLMDKMREAAEIKLKITKGDFYFKPDIGLKIGLSYSGPRFPLFEKDWFRKDNWNLLTTVAIKFRMFDGGKLVSKIMTDTQNVEQAIEKGRQAETEIEKQLNELVSAIMLNNYYIDYYKLKDENDKQKGKVLKLKRDSGTVKEQIDFLKNKIETYKNIINIYSEKTELVKNYFFLMYLIGSI